MLRRYAPDELRLLGDRLWRRVEKSDGCWEWTGAVTTAGYAQLRLIRGPAIGAHRLAYLLEVGPIPDGLFVCHTCDNRRCVRPSHLWLGTNQENQNDALAKGRSPAGERNARARLTNVDIIAIRQRARAGETHRALSAEFGVGRSAITHIVNRRNWRSVA